ncbi:hypothetical protein KOW79_014822 [Hemibagrus wyckioides]|uniref:VWFA domain-containing protein n=1 Tax=Hemibagrus wyckioides TaxID=337641 RepID=A0A9D3SK02_9TELE|nr:hypothetical protein KOW79_014822 [Hemibagrus wyckioides]
MIVSGSEFLFEALDHKLYFKEVKILVPPNWTTGKYERATTECFDKVLRKDDDKTIGDEIIFLTDGEATDNIQECLQEAVQSGSIIHTISFGPKADSVLKIMADQTGGKFYVVPDSKYSYKLVNVFSSLTLFDGNPMTQPIQEMIVSGSEFLFEALDHKLYFKEVKILVPPNWTTGKYERATTQCFDKGRIRIDNANSAFGDEPYTPQVTGCGTEAQYIHFTPKYLLDKDLYKNVYGPKGVVIKF